MSMLYTLKTYKKRTTANVITKMLIKEEKKCHSSRKIYDNQAFCHIQSMRRQNLSVNKKD